MSFANAFSNLFRIRELRKRLFVTLALLGVYRIGVFVTAPGVNRVVMKKAIESSGGFLNLFNLFTGGALDANEGEPGPFYIQGDHTGGMKYRNITIAVPKK